MIKCEEVALDFTIPIMDNGVEMIADIHIPRAGIDYNEDSLSLIAIKEWYDGTIVSIEVTNVRN